MASEMLYPVLPVYLKHIGYSVVFIGFLEGIAEALAGLSKPYFGKQSDAMGKRLPFIQVGYALSAISKPMLALFTQPIWIFITKSVDRLGKGVRNGARDALLSDECVPETKGQVFGFHRSMDTWGAVIGPIIALTYLYFNPFDYTTLFIFAIIPGLLTIICTYLIKEKKVVPHVTHKWSNISFFAFTSYWKKSPTAYKKLAIGLLVFALFNSSDVFLLLKMKESGLADTAIISIYIFYNLVFALFAYPIGVFADKVGFKKMLLFGLFLFASVYFGFAVTNNTIAYIILFAMYGLYAACTDGISKAWISNMVPKCETATAIGTFTGFQSIAALFASTVCGILWYNFGSITTFITTACVTLFAIIYLAKQSTKNNE
ncbi:MAG: MFS transporter [Ferruginibacter sp.]|nr:MFS transporter [Ferruginibacter sp.]